MSVESFLPGLARANVDANPVTAPVITVDALKPLTATKFDVVDHDGLSAGDSE
jgi:hypothetical protein